MASEYEVLAEFRTRDISIKSQGKMRRHLDHMT